MLVPKLCIEHVLELLKCAVIVTRNCNCLCLISGSIDLDKVFELVVVDIVLYDR